jgi:hypothetical protein
MRAPSLLSLAVSLWSLGCGTVVVAPGLGGAGGAPQGGAGGATGGGGSQAGAGGAAGSGGATPFDCSMIEPAPLEGPACDAYADAVCARVGTCAPYWLDVVYGSAEGCQSAVKLQCEQVLGLPGLGYGGPEILACASLLANAPCECQGGDVCAAVGPGTLPAGASCQLAAQCESSTCALEPGTGCGACVEGAALGESCELMPCEQGLFCSLGEGVCAAPLELGAPCAEGDVCDDPLVCYQGVCSERIALGEACPGGGAGVNPCDFAGQGAVCINDVCREVTVVGPGELCGYEIPATIKVCTGDSYCSEALPSQGECLPKTGVGTSCTATPQNPNVSTCLIGYVCEGGTCVPPFSTLCDPL